MPARVSGERDYAGASVRSPGARSAGARSPGIRSAGVRKRHFCAESAQWVTEAGPGAGGGDDAIPAREAGKRGAGGSGRRSE